MCAISISSTQYYSYVKRYKLTVLPQIMASLIKAPGLV